MKSRLTNYSFFFPPVERNQSSIIQNYTGKYMKWSSVCANYICKTISFRGINSQLSNCYICNCKKVNKKFGNEETENSQHKYLSFCYQHGAAAACSCWPCVVNWMIQINIRKSWLLCSEKHLARPVPFSRVLCFTAGDRIFLERINFWGGTWGKGGETTSALEL